MLLVTIGDLDYREYFLADRGILIQVRHSVLAVGYFSMGIIWKAETNTIRPLWPHY
jgi:hypothetical protein